MAIAKAANALRRIARTAAGKRADKKNVIKKAKKVKKATFKKATPSRRTIRQTSLEDVKKRIPPTTKSGARKLLKRFGVPGAIIAGVLATRDTKKATTKKPAAKKETPMKRRFRAGPTAGSGLGSQRRSGTLRGKNVVANPPKRKNKDTAKKPRRPSRPSMTGFRK
mgnify:CR=1 FL=1